MAGYSGAPLSKKLGLTEGLIVYLVNPPAGYFDWLTPMPHDIVVRDKLSGELGFIHLFAQDSETFKSDFLKCKKHLSKKGMLWVSWPKKASKVATDLTENSIRDFGISTGLVDVKVCAVSEIWSGLKFVFRLKDR